MCTLAARLPEATGRALADGHEHVRPVQLDHNPTIGDAPLPARDVLAQRQAMWRVLKQGAPT